MMSFNPVENYMVVSSQRMTNDSLSYTAYGIAYHSPQETLVLYEDISCDERIVNTMVDLFNLCDLPPDRVGRAIADLLP